MCVVNVDIYIFFFYIVEHPSTQIATKIHGFFFTSMRGSCKLMLKMFAEPSVTIHSHDIWVKTTTCNSLICIAWIFTRGCLKVLVENVS